MMSHRISRRAVLAGSAATFAGVSTAGAPRAETGQGDAFVYDVQRTEDEWRAMLSRNEYRILREGGTEWRNSSPLRHEDRAGTYHCKGCGLPLYQSEWKTNLDIGWVFFLQSVPDAVLMGIDLAPNYGGEVEVMEDQANALIETHCRRCGSHLGHLVAGGGSVLHCINGASLVFEPADA